ncbi:DUF4179 domain-containing protein [Cohnella sp. CFH 77786]|uniref:DUF4179 domain-containing protein n=1 Tax=Cohnella sp. CFH 77786 TaxID=2662265 RepID=UPI001C60BFB8|nr:DUF4179 domain-containing protein [Cohnella sp. CFH 77786]MBW5447324.1 DUF4179 domain-containing protein [Cohnella sp. CFH 77786]
MHNPDEQGTVPTLDERIESAIAEGIRRGQAEKSRRRGRVRRRIGGTAAACVLLLACILSIRVSPVFAALVRDIPGMEKFVDLIRHTQDRGIQLALDNDFMQPVGVSDEHDGVKLTVQGIIVDDSRMVLFYDVELPDREERVVFNRAELTDVAGKSLPVTISYHYPQEADQDIREEGVQRGTADFNLVQGVTFPDEVVLNVKLRRIALPDPSAPPEQRAGSVEIPSAEARTAEGTEYTIPFKIDRARFAGLRSEYALNQTVDVEGQKVMFAKAVVTPLKVSLFLEYDSANPKQIFGPGDIRLVDDEGREWTNFLGNLDKNHPVYHFESPYFKETKELYVEGSWFRALDKDKLEVKVDTEKRKVLQSPDDKLALHGVTSGRKYTKLDFSLSGVDEADTMLYSLFDQQFMDADGTRHKAADLREVTSGSAEGTGGREQHTLYYLDPKPYKQPLTFTVENYPQYIRQPYRIKVK